MTLAAYLCIATTLGLTRKDAMLLEIATVYEMASIRAKHSGAARKKQKGGESQWP